MKYHSPSDEAARLKALRAEAAARKAARTFRLADEDILEFKSTVEGATAKLEVTLLPPKRPRRRRARSV